MIFVDTSFWAASRMHRDARHRDSVELLRRAARRLVTSNHVRGETWTLLRRNEGHARAVDFLDMLARSPRVDVVAVGEKLEEESLAWLRRHDEHAYSFVDATSFALMRRLGIRDALAFDGDFAAAGFVELRP